MTKKEQLKELILYITTNHSKKLGMIKLWKLCFFSESDFYENFSERLTGNTYIKNDYGPTPDWKIAKKALEELVNEGLLIKRDGEFFGVAASEYKFLDARKFQSIENTCNKYADLDTNQIIYLAHQEPSYLMADYNKPVDFENVFYRAGEEDLNVEETEQIQLNDGQRRGLMSLVFA